MPTFRLNWLLMGLVLISGIVALLISTAVIFYQLNQKASSRVNNAASTAIHQLTLQQNNRAIRQTGELERYPDFHLWQRSSNHSGLCVTYENLYYESIRGLCLGDVIDGKWPIWFDFFYLSVFDPVREVLKPIMYKGELEGYIRVSTSEGVELNHAWKAFNQLIDVAVIIILVFSVLLYFTLHIALYPARVLQQSLERLHNDGLDARVPDFTIAEWQLIATGINQLAGSLEQTLEERQRLSLKLVSLQEEERRFLCRELHDELGQSLSGLSAVARFMNQQAKEHAPQLVTSTDQVYNISQQMMQLVKRLMVHLRPADFDELGLAESLDGYIGEWNQKHHEIDCILHMSGPLSSIPDPIAMNALRIVQECLTNISKHSVATEAKVSVEYKLDPISALQVTIHDNGQLEHTDFFDHSGKGLLGIRERVFALDGKLLLSPSDSGGLCVSVTIPLLEGNE